MIDTKTYTKIMELMPILCVDAVVRYKNKFLLVKRNNEPLKGEWWVPGGRVNKGELVKEALKKKMKEELGINVKILKCLGYHEIFFRKNKFKIKGKSHFLSIVFLVESASLNLKLDKQSSDWKLADKLPQKFVIKRFD